MKQFGKNVSGVVRGLTNVSAVAIAASAVGHFIGGFYAIASDAFEPCGDQVCPSLGAAKVALSAAGFVCFAAVANFFSSSSSVSPDADPQSAARPGA